MHVPQAFTILERGLQSGNVTGGGNCAKWKLMGNGKVTTPTRG